VVVLDRPEVVAHAQKQRTVPMIGGDFWTHDADLGHDALLLSRVLHDWDDEDASRLLRRWVAPMPSGGLVLICEEMDSAGAFPHPQWAALLDVFLFAVVGSGRVRTPDQVSELLDSAGCTTAGITTLPEGSTLVQARKR
jgi:O-methyltransferase